MVIRLLVLVCTLGVAATTTLRAQEIAQFLIPLSDEQGRPVTTLAPADLSVHENDKPARVLKIEPVDWPVKIVLAIENSRGLGEHLVYVRNGVRDFLTALPEGVEVTLLTTAPQPRTFLKATKDRKALLAAVDRITPDSSSGAFVDVVTEQIERWAKLPRDFTPIMVAMGSTFSDDNPPDRVIKSALDKLPALGATIHTVFYTAPLSTTTLGSGGNQMEFAEEVTARTRGRFENINSAQRIATLLPEIGQDVARVSGGSRLKITIERPAGATGNLGALSISPPGGMVVGRMTRLP